MKKIVSIIILIAVIISFITISMATEVSMSLKPDKEKVEQAEEVKVSIVVSDFTREGIQKAIEAKIEYDSENLEYKEINWKAGWIGSISTDGTGIAASKSGDLSTQETVAEITYVVRENAKKGNTVITGKEILTSSDGDEVEVSNVETTIKITSNGKENSSNVKKIILPICILMTLIIVLIIRYKKHK